MSPKKKSKKSNPNVYPDSYSRLQPKGRALVDHLVSDAVTGQHHTEVQLASEIGYSSSVNLHHAKKSEAVQRAFRDMCEAAKIDPLKPFRVLGRAMDAKKAIPLKGGGIHESEDWTNRIAAVDSYMDRVGYPRKQDQPTGDVVFEGPVNIETLQFFAGQKIVEQPRNIIIEATVEPGADAPIDHVVEQENSDQSQ